MASDVASSSTMLSPTAMSRSSSASSGGSSAESRVGKASRSFLRLAGLTEYRCAHCSTDESVLRLCGNCRTRAYCSLLCQKADWPEHKLRCRLKNPLYFDKDAREQIRWVLELADDSAEFFIALIDAFRLRCIDEYEQASETEGWPRREEFGGKFLRFLHAAKGASVLPKGFGKADFVSARYDALYRHKIADIDPHVTMTEMATRHATQWPTVLVNLRNLHRHICGPILCSDGQLNII